MMLYLLKASLSLLLKHGVFSVLQEFLLHEEILLTTKRHIQGLPW